MTRPFSTSLFAVLQGPMRFHDFCRGCFNEHGQGPPEHPRCTEPVMLGRLHARSIVTFRSRDNHRGYAGSGAEDHRTSTFPFEIAPKRDFAPTPIASDASCRADRSSTLSGATWIKNDLANAIPLAGQGRREGRETPDFREEIRCSRARGAFHRKTVCEQTGSITEQQR